MEHTAYHHIAMHAFLSETGIPEHNSQSETMHQYNMITTIRSPTLRAPNQDEYVSAQS
jgi:hypothetical protein